MYNHNIEKTRLYPNSTGYADIEDEILAIRANKSGKVQEGGLLPRLSYLHICKKSAFELCDQGEFSTAFRNMLADLQKHPDTKLSSFLFCAFMGSELELTATEESTRKFIAGFN